MSGSFTFRRIEQLRPAIARICGEPLDTSTAADDAAPARLPEQLAALRTEPGLWWGVMEELLRHLTDVHSGLRRIATEDVEVAGVRIRAGEGVVVAVDATNSRMPSMCR